MARTVGQIFGMDDPILLSVLGLPHPAVLRAAEGSREGNDDAKGAEPSPRGGSAAGTELIAEPGGQG